MKSDTTIWRHKFVLAASQWSTIVAWDGHFQAHKSVPWIKRSTKQTHPQARKGSSSESKRQIVGTRENQNEREKFRTRKIFRLTSCPTWIGSPKVGKATKYLLSENNSTCNKSFVSLTLSIEIFICLHFVVSSPWRANFWRFDRKTEIKLPTLEIKEREACDRFVLFLLPLCFWLVKKKKIYETWLKFFGYQSNI